MPNFSSWRDDLREVVDSDTPEQNVKEIKDKKGIKNKVIINPTIPESLQEIGGELIDIREIDESAEAIALSPQELAIQKRKAQLDVRLTKKRQQSMNKIKADAVDIEKQDELHQQQDKKMAKEEIQLSEVKISRISSSDSKEDKKKKVQQMLDRQAEWEDKKKKALHASHEPQGEHIDEGKCEGCTCPGCSPDGVGHQNPCVECGGHHKEEKVREEWKPDPVEKRKKKAADLYRREKIAQDTPAKYKTDKTENPDKLYKRRMAVDSKTKMKEDKAFDNVVASLRKKHGKDAILTKDSPKPKPQPKAKPQPQKPLSAKEKAQREEDARYGRTPWNKKGSLGT